MLDFNTSKTNCTHRFVDLLFPPLKEPLDVLLTVHARLVVSSEYLELEIEELESF